MRRYLQRKLRAMFLWHFRDDIRLAYDQGYLTGSQDAGGPAFEEGQEEGYARGCRDGYNDGYMEGLEAGLTDTPCDASPS